jgi:hypothetical protein
MTAGSPGFGPAAHATASRPAANLDPSSHREAGLTSARALDRQHDGCHLELSTSASGDRRPAKPPYKQGASSAPATHFPQRA